MNHVKVGYIRQTAMLLWGIVAVWGGCKKDDDDHGHQGSEVVKYDTIYQKEYYQRVIKEQAEITTDIRPQYLQSGDKIGIFALSNAVTESDLQNGIKTLEGWGLTVVEAGNLYAKDGRYAGTIEERLDGFRALWEDPEIKAMIAARGGYGAIQIVGMMDFLDDVIASNQAKWVVGFSDVSALHAALQNHGIESIHGVMVNNMTDEYSVEMLRKCLFGDAVTYSIKTNRNCITGEAEGRLVGGNLTTIYSLAGGAEDLNMKNAILLIEDTGEAHYNVDRMLMNLELGGKMDQIKGIVVGEFTSMTQGQDKSIGEIIKDRLNGRNIPVLYGISIGHGVRNEAIRLGGRVKLVVGEKESSITMLD